MIDLYNGECLEVMDVLIEKGVKVDAIITDPPYGTTGCKWDSVIPFDAMWERLNKLIKKGGAIVLFGSEPFSSALRMSNIKNYKYDWVWNKKKSGNIMLAKLQPMKITECVSVFNNTKDNYFPIMEKLASSRTSRAYSIGQTMGGRLNYTKDTLYTHTYPVNIITVSNASQKGKVHPTQKPVALLDYIIRTYTKEHETVLDFTMGSGTTGVACVLSNRGFIGIELDEKYFNLAKKRIENPYTKLEKEKPTPELEGLLFT